AGTLPSKTTESAEESPSPSARSQFRNDSMVFPTALASGESIAMEPSSASGLTLNDISHSSHRDSYTSKLSLRFWGRRAGRLANKNGNSDGRRRRILPNSPY